MESFVARTRIVRIDREHPLYEQALDLRERVLLRPIGLDIESFFESYREQEAKSRHIVAVIDHPSGERVVGVVMLMPDSPEKGVGKLSQMAVDPQLQNEGYGRLLVAEVEKMAVGELGLAELYCHAQSTAVGFYKKMGWSIEGDMFMEAGIEHYKMVFRPDPESVSRVQTVEHNEDES